MAISRRARRGLQPLLHAKVRRRHEERTKEQRRAAALLGHVRTEALSKDVQLELGRQLDVVADLANKHNVAPDKVKKLLMHYRRGTKPGTVNNWNIHFHAVSVKVNGPLPKGQKKKKAEILKIARDSYEDFKNQPAEERTKAVLEYEEHRNRAKRGIRSEPKSRSQEIDQTARRITDDLSGMGIRCATSSMFFTVRTEHLHTNAPCFFIDNTAQEFLQNAFEITPQEFASKFENYALSGMSSLAANAKDQKGEYKKLVRDLLVAGLQEITKLKIAMEYKHYVQNIVLTHRVMLKGWPDNIPIEKNIDYCSLTNIRLLACKLRSGEIHWAEVSEDELTQFKERTPQVRAERSDKGLKRAPYRKRQQDEEVDDNTNSSTRNGSKDKRSRKRKRPAPVSDNDDDDDDDDDNGTATGRPRPSVSRKGKGRAADVRSSSARSSSSTRTRQTSSVAQDLTPDAVNAESDAFPVSAGAPTVNTNAQTDGSPLATQSSSARSSEPRQVASNTQGAEPGSFCLTVNASDKNAWQANDMAMPPGAGFFSDAGGLLPLAPSDCLTVNAAFQTPAAIQFNDGSLNDFLHMPSTSEGILRLPTPPVFGSQAMDLSHPSLHNILPHSSSPNLMFPDFSFL